jgi:hypothetical protein
MSGNFWGCAFQVSEAQDFESRYNESKGSVGVPFLDDLTLAHDLAVTQLNNYGLAKPYAVYLSGSHDYSTPGAVSVTVEIHPVANLGP